MFFKFSVLQGYRIYRLTSFTLSTKVSYIPKSVRIKINGFLSLLTKY